jgi:hypothetical protein
MSYELWVMSYELVKPLRGRVNALRAVKRVKSFLTPEGRGGRPMNKDVCNS